MKCIITYPIDCFITQLLSERNGQVIENLAVLFILVPKAGLEPARSYAPPPQDGVSTNSTTSAEDNFLLAGSLCRGRRSSRSGGFAGCRHGRGRLAKRGRGGIDYRGLEQGPEMEAQIGR